MPTNEDSQDKGEVRWVNPNDLVPGPIRHESLSDDQVKRARAVYRALQPFVAPTFEQFELNFLRDSAPEIEIQIWENIAYAFQRYSQRCGPLDEADEQTLFRNLLLISMCAPKPDDTPKEYWEQILAIYDGKA